MPETLTDNDVSSPVEDVTEPMLVLIPRWTPFSKIATESMDGLPVPSCFRARKSTPMLCVPSGGATVLPSVNRAVHESLSMLVVHVPVVVPYAFDAPVISPGSPVARPSA